jgi:hypothetical protein
MRRLRTNASQSPFAIINIKSNVLLQAIVNFD